LGLNYQMLLIVWVYGGLEVHVTQTSHGCRNWWDGRHGSESCESGPGCPNLNV